MIEQAGLSIAISEGAGLRIADCPETFSPAVNLALIFLISFSTHFAGEMQGLRTVHISGVTRAPTSSHTTSAQLSDTTIIFSKR
jgi:hypothetical protein